MIVNNAIPYIESDRLLLRPYEYGDEKDILELVNNNREKLKDVLDKKTYLIKTINEAKEYIAETKLGWKLYNLLIFGLWHKPTLTLIGQRYFFNIDWEKKRLEGGGFIIYEYEGLFIPKEAAELCVDYAFKTLKINEIRTSCKVDNRASIFGIERSGYDRVGEKQGLIFYSMSFDKYLRRKSHLTELNYREKYLKIHHNDVKLAGIFRELKNSDTLIILLPALTGTRIGPQRIFVDIARKVAMLGVSSYCIDIPPMGDSIDIKNSFCSIEEKYVYYLDLIISYFKMNYAFKNYILLSISIGCLPTLKFATKGLVQKIILLSPADNNIKSKRLINLKSLKECKYKLYQAKTWYKVFNFKLNYSKIVKNIFSTALIKNKAISNNREKLNYIEVKLSNRKFDLLCIVGGKYYSNNVLFDYKSKGYLNSFREILIENSDYSFFTWDSRRQVIKYIIDWLR